jgi:hypothetical protein
VDLKVDHAGLVPLGGGEGGADFGRLQEVGRSLGEGRGS